MAVTICGRTLDVPILQGGMGIGISLERLAGAVAACGGMGTISAAMGGFREPDFSIDPQGANLRALARQIRRAKDTAQGRGMVAVNVMAATRQYADSVRMVLRAGADAVVCGAGLPKDLPALAAQVPESNAALAPIVSSGRAAALLCRLWERYGRIPDFVVLEGPMAGGHLGFSPEEARSAVPGEENPLHRLLAETLNALEPFRQKYSRDIPVFVAGGVRSGREMARYMREGAAGVQFATRFITTEECDADEAYKQILLGAKPEDITITVSPVGMPGRALNSPLLHRLAEGERIAPKQCYRCLTSCDPGRTPYCITRALLAARSGDWENGLFFCGGSCGKDRLTTVREEVEQLMREWSAEQ